MQSETSVFEVWLNRAYKPGTINKTENSRFELADFHTCFEIWALFEGWKDIPKDIQQQLNEWELTYYEDRNGKKRIKSLFFSLNSVAVVGSALLDALKQ